LFEHANWKERKLAEKRQIEEAKFSYAPQTNSRKFRPSGGPSMSQSRLSVHERLYTHGQRKRTASLTAKRAEILEKGKGAFSKYTDKPGYSALNSRMPPPPQSDAQSDNGSYYDPTDGASSVTSSRSAPSGNNGHPGGSRGGRFGPSGGMSMERGRSASSTRSSTRRTDALYLESILRQQRRQAKLRDKEDEHSFQPDLSRGRSLYREPFEKTETRGTSVHDRLYEDGLKKREHTQDVVAKVYGRSRIARNRRIQEFGMESGDILDQNGDFMDEWETKSLGGFSMDSSTSTTHTQRTDALYLEATLRRARRDEKARRSDPNLTFQPNCSRDNVSGGGNSSNRSHSTGRYRSTSEVSGISRHDLLYLDGERKRQRNIDSRLDPNQRGTGELVGEYNKHWNDAARLQKFNPLLITKSEDNINRRHSRDEETRSLDGFSVATDHTSRSGRSHTRRTEALYLEASLRAARKEAMREAYADQGNTYQPSIKDTTWGETRSFVDVVSRLYNPAALEDSKNKKEINKHNYEIKDFIGKPMIKSSSIIVKSHQKETNPFERLHKNAKVKEKTIETKTLQVLESEKKAHTFEPNLLAQKPTRSLSQTRSWIPKTGAATTKPNAPTAARTPSRASVFLENRRKELHQTKPNGPSSSSSSSSSSLLSASNEPPAQVGEYDSKTGRSVSALPPPPEPKPLSALERFRLRQAERAKKRDEEAAMVAEAQSAAQSTSPYKYRSSTASSSSKFTPSSGKAAHPKSDDPAVQALNPLLAASMISTH